MVRSGGERARFYRRAALGVKAVAALLIAGGGVYQFSSPAPWAAAGSGLQALFSVKFHDGNRFQISWGPEAHPDAGPVAAVNTRPEAPAPQPSAMIAASAAPSSPPIQPVPAATPASLRNASTPRSFEACSIGERNAGNRAPIVSRASIDVADVHLNAFGLSERAIASDGPGEAGYVLPVLAAIRSQGAVASFRADAAAPSGHGRRKLPNTLSAVTSEDGAFALGAAHGALDLIEVGRGSYVDELNAWYHALNAGMRTAIVGPMQCTAIEDPRVLADPLEGPRIQSSRIAQRFAQDAPYVSDGASALQEFTVERRSADQSPGSEVRLVGPGPVTVSAKLRATLPDRPVLSPDVHGWNLERARYGATRSVIVEVVVNGAVAASKPIAADGSLQAISLQIPIESSSWVALRLMGAGHSNPVYVIVDNQPIHPSRSSVEWSQRALMHAYEAQNGRWTAEETPQAAAAFRYAFARYGAILARAVGP